ncbi:MAG: hypothetical protein H0T73_08575 [Ardenticatenales bacterium]|nr:hypothetical protein [Ardenticatenales bacterium]
MEAEKQGYIFLRLPIYLEELRQVEGSKPKAEQRPVPTMKQLALVAGIHPVTMSRLVRGRIVALNLQIGASSIAEMRQQGFDMQLSDLLGYTERG